MQLTNFKRKTCIALLYAIIICLSNWSILLGTNYMKWDIYEAHLPFQLMFSDAIRNGELMLWNPLLNYGTPYYASIGTPVWYPVTLLLNCVGYNVRAMAIEYCIHLVVAAYGMFNLILDEDKTDNTRISTCTAFLGGLLYTFSGVFLSNASHIMIIISSAWIPWTLMYARRAVRDQGTMIKNIMLAGLVTGFQITGGYPELFYNLVMIMFSWILYFGVEKERSPKQIVKTLGIFCGIVAATLFSAAITLFPFIRIKDKISRGEGQIPITNPWYSLFSMIMPGTADKLNGLESTLGLYYVGIITLLLIPAVFKYKKKYSFYLLLAFVSLYASMGNNSFIHSLLYRFMPMYSTFRFPSTFRSFMALFVILGVTPAIADIISRKDSTELTAVIRKATVITSLLAMICWLVSILSENQNLVGKARELSEGAFVLLLILLVYCYALRINSEEGNVNAGRMGIICFVAAVIMECLIVGFKVFPITIGKYPHVSYYSYPDDKADVEHEISGRLRKTELTGVRGMNGINSNKIADNKIFDEEGYVSIKLGKTEGYKTTYNRSIGQQNPELYFTNDITGPENIQLYEWLDRADAPAYQIWAPGEYRIDDLPKVSSHNDVMDEEKPATFTLEDHMAELTGEIRAGSDTVTRIRIYFFDHDGNANIRTLFTTSSDSGGKMYEYEGVYDVQKDKEGYYADISLPDVHITYESIKINSDICIKDISIVELSRAISDKNVKASDYDYNGISADIDAPTDGMLVYMQANYDGWKAYVDGIRTEIIEINGCFMGLPVSAGEHNIRFVFDPWDFKVGLGFTIAYYFGLVAYLIIKFYNKTYKIHYKE